VVLLSAVACTASVPAEVPLPLVSSRSPLFTFWIV